MSACVWHRKSVQLQTDVFFFLSWTSPVHSFAKAQEVIYRVRYPNRSYIYVSIRQPAVKAAVTVKREQAMQPVKPRDRFSSQLKQLAGLQLSCLRMSLWCIGKTPGCVRHPHRTNRHDIRHMVPLERHKDQAGCLLAQEATRSTEMTLCLPYFSC